jgi:hypothetical protein
MTVQDTRTDVVPTPRSAATGDAAWVEPWLYARSTRPRSEYWDVENACWNLAADDPRPPVGQLTDQAPRRRCNRVSASSRRASPSASLRRSRT